ncbi:hypothetical protein NDU88_002751 [Pleurodeles waltl]|uniref:Uncharacterized protein n=1 Tax=Pleurodeles waltl TaxID=8319 RepID=A0AAV7RG96_PLEWA|nr:hypothetical protein NDU88_002751 [Pleurodeles waltl]
MSHPRACQPHGPSGRRGVCLQALGHPRQETSTERAHTVSPAIQQLRAPQRQMRLCHRPLTTPLPSPALASACARVSELLPTPAADPRPLVSKQGRGSWPGAGLVLRHTTAPLCRLQASRCQTQRVPIIWAPAPLAM